MKTIIMDGKYIYLQHTLQFKNFGKIFLAVTYLEIS